MAFFNPLTVKHKPRNILFNCFSLTKAQKSQKNKIVGIVFSLAKLGAANKDCLSVVLVKLA
jgi:hypothetical protein